MKLRKAMLEVFRLLLVLSVIAPLAFAEQGYQDGELTKIGMKYGTDKAAGHNYTEVYEHFFYPIKHKARAVCEIGIDQGASLKMLRDYFPQAVIYGIDILDKSSLDSDTIKTFIADQANRKKLRDFVNKSARDFDIILDDGGHTMEQQQVSFGYLFRYVKPGGYYIIEDVHTSFMSGFGVKPDRQNTTFSMINNFIKTGVITSEYMTQEEAAYLSAHIAYCNLLCINSDSITCIFKKK